jgi:hypothetical protein
VLVLRRRGLRLRLFAAVVRVVETNFETFKMIKAIRLRIDADGNVRPDKAEFEISRREYDARGKD